jgi:hypothetical protein
MEISIPEIFTMIRDLEKDIFNGKLLVTPMREIS